MKKFLSQSIKAFGLGSLLASGIALSAEIKPSGPAKTYKGPEGEKITVVEVNDGKEVLIRFQKIGGDIEGKTNLYKVNIMSRSEKEYYYQKKKGSKMKDIPIMYQNSSGWTLVNPNPNGQNLKLTYSEKDSENVNPADLVSAYKP